MRIKTTIARGRGDYRTNKTNKTYGLRLLLCLVMFCVQCSMFNVQAQIRIGGNVYGGGNEGNVDGSTKVTVKAGDLQGKVYGGARMANVGGNAFVNIDGKDATDDMVINMVYGGNDISGTIGTAAVPAKLKEKEPGESEAESDTYGVDETWNAFVHVSTKLAKFTQAEADAYNTDNGLTAGDEGYKTPADDKIPATADPDAKKVFIGQVFAAGNGDYTYYNPGERQIGEDAGTPIYSTTYDVVDRNRNVIASKSTAFTKPNLAKTFIDIHGGTIGYIYGGGNNATVTGNTVICVNNPSEDVITQMYDREHNEMLTYDRVYGKDQMALQGGGYTDVSKDEFLSARLFGGNNLAEMAIRPKWHLKNGSIRDIYSGGNRGAMTSPEGLLLEIPEESKIRADNVYGGCRMADVIPTVNGEYKAVTNLQDKDEYGNPLYYFPPELSARMLVKGGQINNVYGGNDITGSVYGGSAVGIYANVSGNVYGGGNGAYPYTDNSELKDNDIYGDFYYNPTDVITKYALSPSSGLESVTALNKFRPNAEQVSIRLKGKPGIPTIIHGSVFCGGNCASLDTKKEQARVELKIGSYAIADKVFLGNNGEGMVTESILSRYAGNVESGGSLIDFSTLDLTTSDIFDHYMDGVVMHLQPSIVFDDTNEGDPDNYIDWTTKIGSFYCGGNVGSMAIPDKNIYDFERGLIVYEKIVGGCNNANVPERDGLNAAYEGGILGVSDELAPDGLFKAGKSNAGNILDRLQLDLSNVRIEPSRWKDTYVAVPADKTLTAGNTYYLSDTGANPFISDGTESSDGTNYYELSIPASTELVWNTAQWVENYNPISTGTLLAEGKTYYTHDAVNDKYIRQEAPAGGITTDGSQYSLEQDFENIEIDEGDDKKRRLMGGNVYGGCYNSGHVNGNVVININQTLIDKDKVFAKTDNSGNITTRNSGVILDEQRDDLMAVSMTVFGAGYGEETEIWGSTTVNHNNGYCFQIFGGGEEGVVGKKDGSAYDAAYSSTVNLQGPNAGYSEKETGLPLAETEYIYGGGNEGDVFGDSYVYLGNGRIYDAFGGASNANIWGVAETYIGYNGGFPWIRDNIYGGNDFGGTIKGSRDFSTGITRTVESSLLESATYVKYIQGRVDNIFGGNYGSYDYSDRIYQDYTDAIGRPLKDGDSNPIFSFPHLDDNSFVYFQPSDNSQNKVGNIFGGSEGVAGHPTMNNTMQNESYVLIDDINTKDAQRFANVDVFGGGNYAGLGSSTAIGAGRTTVDLYAGSLNNVYGGSNQEGLIGFARVRVPEESSIEVNSIFGGGKGYDAEAIESNSALAARFCDNFVTLVDYHGANAIVNEAIYGGNHNSRISCDTYLHIGTAVKAENGKWTSVFGAGYGNGTVSGRTNVFLNSGAVVKEVYGGGRDGNVFNYVSLAQWLAQQYTKAGSANVLADLANYRAMLDGFGTYIASNPISLHNGVGTYANNFGEYDGTYTNDILPLTSDLKTSYNNTNVHIMTGAKVKGNPRDGGGTDDGYAYGGGLGSNAVVAGTTLIELKGGTVEKDIYGGGTQGPVYDKFKIGTSNFKAGTYVNIEGGIVRNVFGGGWKGNVGRHTGNINEYDIADPDIYGDTHVVIGQLSGTDVLHGIPAIQRNVYGGGEGGSVFGTTNLTINNGYIGYLFEDDAEKTYSSYSDHYIENIHEYSEADTRLKDNGNAFGGGYVASSYVDNTNVEMYGGTVRGSLYGGGEISPIGRGTMKDVAEPSWAIKNGGATIYKAGKTLVKMYDGHVKRNVFGGGRGVDSWGGNGWDAIKEPDLTCKGYVFGQTEVNVYGGEVGTEEGVAQGYGNVFGGGDIGTVYSAYEDNGVLCIGKKSGKRYNDGIAEGAAGYGDEGYYYKYSKSAGFVTVGSEKILTEDCKVVVEPWFKANNDITINGEPFAAGDFVSTDYLHYLGNKNTGEWTNLGKPAPEDVNKNGIIVHNAVFAGGNTSPGSSAVYAYTTTVYGNATASIHDVYNRDFISIGKGRVGGLYGDGNLTLVDGYRELNITNYGTDYYNIDYEITKEEHDLLPDREAAYYEIRYKCAISCKDKDGKTYSKGSTITADEMETVFVGVSVPKRNVSYDGEGNIILDSDGYPISTADSGTVPMLDPDTGIPQLAYWIENGVCSRYQGRPMNTIQRADFCGIFGSRMVMQGAQDRVPATVDYTNYTINRVREVSLNKKTSVRSADASDARNKAHGNYFGIYSVVNFLGALTSDVDFGPSPDGDLRVTENDNHELYDPDYDPTKVTITATDAALATLAANPIPGVTVSGSTVTASTVEALYKLRSVLGVEITGGKLTNQTYYDWKALHHDERKRNNGASHNKVALASGVYLELTSEKGTGKGLYEKDWGYITGVVELDLISVQPGLGGGFVYAKNEHGVRSETGKKQTILTALNETAVTNKHFTYTTEDPTKKEWETSGNFIHSTQTIIDDCYNIGDKYLGSVNPDGSGAMPAHYWYIKGSIYVYDQYISAYTGLPNAYSEVVNIPLTITSASHGKLTLLDVMPNRYAYYSGVSKEKLGASDQLVLRDVTYHLNDPISYWDYYMLSADEKKLFESETYVVTSDCTIGDGASQLSVAAGTVLLAGDENNPEEGTYYYYLQHAGSKLLEEGDTEETKYVHHVEKDKDVAFDDVFHLSNNAGHDTGYILTYKVDNPKMWDAWYTPKTGDSNTGKKDREEIKGLSRDDYEDGPTYTPKTGMTGLYGQQEYKVGNIISENVYNKYGTAFGKLTTEQKGALPTQATFEPAYVVTVDILNATNKDGVTQRFYKGATLAKSDYIIYDSDGTTILDKSKWDAIESSVTEAYVVTSTVQLSETEYIYRDTYMTSDERTTYISEAATSALATEIGASIVPAYYCATPGEYGGDYYQEGHNYRGLEAYSSLSEDDRKKFIFNYDALDLLIDPEYSRAQGVKYQYDGPVADNNHDNDIDEDDVTNKAHYSLPTSIDYTATYKGEGSFAYVSNEKDNEGQNITKTCTYNTELDNVEYERLLNERYYYSPITVKDLTMVVEVEGVSKTVPYPYYVVNQTIILGDTPYAAGQVIDMETFNGLTDKDKANVTKLTFNAAGTYYYCREGYKIAAELAGGKTVTKASGVSGEIYEYDETTKEYEFVPADVAGTYSYTEDVPNGLVITESNFKDLTNKQANFVIHGLAPTETSTLYVPGNSDINDLSTEKIITVIYRYDYVENDMAGLSITPVSEYHVLNIHLSFKSGVPTVEDIQEPDIVLPGTSVSIPEPFVTPGAYEVTGGGWTIFDDPSDAESHINGIEYTQNADRLYLYQDNYLVAYYAKTYLGKTYSNAVPVHVANYHDMKEVMDATEHHYYIDHEDLFKGPTIREPKIYINDYTTDDPATSQNGLDLFKKLYDLSVLDQSTVTTDSKTGVITNEGHPFEGHKPLNTYVAAGNNLEIFFRTDVDHSGSEWSPIAGEKDGEGHYLHCFEGTLHGDGHHLAGLNPAAGTTGSLFGKLCGQVYNLGVTGSFTGGGIVDEGNGYVENCWVSTTGTPGTGVKAVFGNPSEPGYEQVVNCYYPETNVYTAGKATPMPERAFYNGEVAYDLNGFYLHKRYYHGTNLATGKPYYYLPVNPDGTLPDDLSIGHYPADYAIYPLDNFAPAERGYVEQRFWDGDFRYVNHSIPTEEDERHYTETVTVEGVNTDVDRWAPIWPDDYIFFGQLLTYGYGAKDHQPVPKAVTRNNGRLSQTADANRVYRAPAYFRSKEMKAAHFNPNTYLAQYKKGDASVEAYPHMTAIDFAGHYDTHTPDGPKDYLSEWNDGKFYPPLLDDDGLLSIKNCDETQNLLVYAPAKTAAAAASGYGNEKTYTVLNNYFVEPVYNDYYSDPDNNRRKPSATDAERYRLVADATNLTLYGHLVQSNKNATNDHLLVDKQDFNCPIAYDFDSDYLMWYQRKPEDQEFVDHDNGWQGISLPFSAELVTTNDKGEITHFYASNKEKENSKNGTGTKIGHEYWLREFNSVEEKEVTVGESTTTVAYATFGYPSSSVPDTKTMDKKDENAVTNTFLWDYYYEGVSHGHKDKNDDTYQTYYETERDYTDYPLLTNGRPYILGLPGATYYEFDLSGTFDAKTTAPTKPNKLDKQVITFASRKGEKIEVSDDEMVNVTKTDKNSTNYSFKPSYLNEEMNVGTFVLNSDGNAYTRLSASAADNTTNKVTTTQYAFRPYFMETGVGGPKKSKGGVRSIVFSRETAEMIHPEEDDDISNIGELIIKAKRGKIIVTSTMLDAKDVTIVTAAGALIDRYTIQPGQTIETQISASGVYIVNKKKLSVKIKD